jgi:hypothetical protein
MDNGTGYNAPEWNVKSIHVNVMEVQSTAASIIDSIRDIPLREAGNVRGARHCSMLLALYWKVSPP